MNDLDSIGKKVIEIAKQAGEIANTYFHSQTFEHHEKSDIDVVTTADLEIDSFLQKELKHAFPNTQFLTEETAPKDFSSFSTAENLWIIDPIDGTVNFSRQNPNFAISIAFVHKSKTKLSVIYNPVFNSLYYTHIQEKNVFLNNKPITVSQVKELRKAVLGCDWSWSLEKRALLIEWLQKIYKHVRQIKCTGSCVYDLANLAEGKIDAYMITGVKPWDVAAASLLVTKAGGVITKPNGEIWNVFDPDFVATNSLLHSFLVKLLH